MAVAHVDVSIVGLEFRIAWRFVDREYVACL
jgi:hypothetical protein